ncbi:hypothetical protein QWY99_08485 [Flavobacterium branchiarum]|uniref:Uncharacterized protein n=1 Tax=Flavobacterium branchiarum TaxID=1114870 RepID=A0ABV5FPV4_9FLAO|nr:hypothetical protein [Flavobacterium branchiarum]MDN3673083.1 hypothetical protein [Flavobacterium branchiarum]
MKKVQKTASAVLLTAIALAVSNYFAQEGAKSEVFSTSDGFLFENLVFATNHAATLEDKNVTPHSNANNIEVFGETDLSDKTIELNADQLELLNNGLVKENYNSLKQLVAFLKLESVDQKAESLIAVLTAYKESLQK